MKICKICKGTSIRSRVNYSHGKGSKSTMSFNCRGCGSTEVEVRSERASRKRR